MLCQLVVWAGAWPPALTASSLLHNRKELGLTQWKGTWGDTAFSFCFFPFLFSNELSANAFRTLDEILTSPKCTAFSERGGLRGWNMRCPFSLGMRQKTVREMHRRLGGNGNPCRGGMGPLFHQRAFKETRTESGPQTMSEGGKPWVTRRACRPSGSPTSGRWAAPSLSLHHPDTQGASHWVSCWLCF